MEINFVIIIMEMQQKILIVLKVKIIIKILN